MRSSVKEEIKSEIMKAVKKQFRLNVKGFVYDPIAKSDVRSPDLEDCLIKLIRKNNVFDVYKFKKKRISSLDHVKGVSNSSTKYLVKTIDITNELLSELLLDSEDEPIRGSIVFECTIDDPVFKQLLENCYDPGFLSSLKYVMTEAATRKAKKLAHEVSNKKNRIVLVLSESGVDTIALFAGRKEILDSILKYAYKNCLQSYQYKKNYCSD